MSLLAQLFSKKFKKCDFKCFKNSNNYVDTYLCKKIKNITVYNLNKNNKMKLSYNVNRIRILLILWTIWPVFFFLGYKYLKFSFKFNTHIPAYIFYTCDSSHILNYSSMFVLFFQMTHSRAKNSRPSVKSLFESKKIHKIFLIITLQFLSRAQILLQKCLI
jgi:hypothetical protein